MQCSYSSLTISTKCYCRKGKKSQDCKNNQEKKGSIFFKKNKSYARHQKIRQQKEGTRMQYKKMLENILTRDNWKACNIENGSLLTSWLLIIYSRKLSIILLTLSCITQMSPEHQFRLGQIDIYKHKFCQTNYDIQNYKNNSLGECRVKLEELMVKLIFNVKITGIQNSTFLRLGFCILDNES